MRHPSKRHAAIETAQSKKRAAIENNDPEQFAQAVAEIQTAEAQEDEYTCVCCGQDFAHGAHMDLLVASVVVFGADGEPEHHLDYGLSEAQRGESGRRIKVCGTCMATWVIPVVEYVEMR